MRERRLLKITEETEISELKFSIYWYLLITNMGEQKQLNIMENTCFFLANMVNITD